MDCPLCMKQMKIIEYEGIEIGSCDGCLGEWLDGDELNKIARLRLIKCDKEVRRAIAAATPAPSFKLEKVQVLVEGWEDLLREDLKEYSGRLRDVDVEEAGEVEASKIPIIGPFINAVVNGILDITH